jgi:hypothetical protein
VFVFRCSVRDRLDLHSLQRLAREEDDRRTTGQNRLKRGISGKLDRTRTTESDILHEFPALSDPADRLTTRFLRALASTESNEGPISLRPSNCESLPPRRKFPIVSHALVVKRSSLDFGTQ